MCLRQAGVRCPHKVSVSLFTFGTWDRAQLVGLGIPLRFIAKPSYSPLGTNPNDIYDQNKLFVSYFLVAIHKEFHG
jgi:hypothetical protein